MPKLRVAEMRTLMVSCRILGSFSQKSSKQKCCFPPLLKCSDFVINEGLCSLLNWDIRISCYLEDKSGKAKPS